MLGAFAQTLVVIAQTSIALMLQFFQHATQLAIKTFKISVEKRTRVT